MSQESNAPAGGNQRSMVADIVRRFVTIAIFILLQAVILFGVAGRLNWVWAWVFLAICLLTVLINGAIAVRVHPETIAERGRLPKTAGFDKVVSSLGGLALYVVIPLLAGLDERFHWTRGLSPAWNVAGGVALAAAWALVAWAMITNAYFSTAVRIQTERGHTVCSSGPYRFVRHPGYVGFGVQPLATALLLGSLWAMPVAIATTVLMVIRTSLEDRFLQAELPGYVKYAQQVRYRLLPGIW
jgi:protein-S-isoprenylcysteine O-methyltransferase Ste14